jgi:hypothetical protein
MNQSILLQQQYLAEPLAPEQYAQFIQQAEFSLQKMADAEAQEQQPFDQFLADYYQQYNDLAAI